MNDAMKKLQKELTGDGPAERQILLMKLLHEFENAPDFGDNYVADASSPPQQWIARVGALLARVGLEYKHTFQAIRKTSATYWKFAREPMRQQLLAATEEIKLELELDGREEIGQVYEAQQQYDFLRDLKEIIFGAKVEVFVVDPYFDGAAFETYLGQIGNGCKIRVLCGKYSKDLAGHISAFSAQFGVVPELKKSNKIHDRLVILDNSDCWIVGGSIKDGGKKPTYLVPLQPSIAPSKISIYEALWQTSQSV